MISFKILLVTFTIIDYYVTCAEVKSLLLSGQDQQEEMTLASLIGGGEILPKNLVDKIEEFIIPTLNISSNALCRNHSEIYISGLRNRESWAYQMLDSSAKLQSGTLTGNLIAMGNFDECIAVSGVKTEYGDFKGKHCLASLTWANGTFMATKDLFNNLRKLGMPSSVTLKWGFCIPSTCEAKDLEASLKDLLYKDISVSVDELDCHTTTDKEFKTIDYVAIAVFIFFGFVVILSTTYDLFHEGTRKELFLAFSLYTNGKKLLSTANTADSLPTLHGIRFLSICWIVVGHRYMVSTEGPAINLTFLLHYTRSFKTTLVVNSQLGVDTFLVLSGFLVSYIFLKHMDKGKKKSFNVFLYYLHRYIRITPALAVMILVQLSLIDHMGSGPLWDRSNSILTQFCKENWWSALLYVQNYVSGDRMCVGHSWYLSVDMQLVWLSPILLLALLKWRRKWNLAILGAIMLIGIAISFIVIYVNEFPVGVRAGVGPKWDARNKYEYVKTHTRFTPWVIGLGLGYIMYEIRSKTLQLSKIQVIGGWMLASVCLLGAVYGILPFQQPDYDYNALESASYNCLHRTVWSFGVSWMIFACVSGYGGPLNSFLSWRAFLPFSRLSYCIYLVHYTFLIYRNFSSRVPAYLNDINVVSLYFGDLFLSILLAAALSLVFEVPIITIEKILLKRGEQQSSQERDITRNVGITEGGNVNQGFATHNKECKGSTTINIAVH